MIFSTIYAQEKLITPPYLQPGDTIAILAPAGILKNREATIYRAKKLAESWGLKVILGKHIFNQNSHFAGTDNERAEDFQNALDNPNIKAIWSGRGGYGSVRVLDKLDYTTFLKQPKWIIGYSDITAFHSHIHNLGVETMHAMMGTSVDEKPESIIETVASFKIAIFGKQLKYTVPSSNYNKKGVVSGQLVGGNLALLSSMLGSNSQTDTKGKILFIEEIGEYKYSIDRMLQSLKRAGYFDNCAGLIIGDISRIKNNSTKWGSSIEQLVLDVVKEYDFPVMFDFPAGHEPDNRALIFGRNIQLTVGSGKSSVVFEE
ncbi:LD-carboxypeptidase [Polaribacter undariae]|uniref:LD-carboxypeptidase n=1 Tax=Polaribacter sejongensis TaxID=985043 RepID=A0AAJ1VFG8_9FLAO|nr:LD-carboxypeptidase [Polaribacter undariae]MDN3618299.1 LD-carboxypeptidase [Polaribacter undariae]UWD30713.1 LD-carboxypeptidase [Polaribacter undariae]